MSVRAAFILPSFAGGGAERVVLNLLGRVDGARIEAHLIVLDGGGPLASMAPGGLPLTDLGKPRLRVALPALIRALRRIRPEAIVSTMGHVNVALLALRPLLAGRPALVMREANTPSKSLAQGRRSGLMRWAYRRWYPRADMVLCNSSLMAREMAERIGVPAGRVHLLPNPIETEAIRANATPASKREGVHFIAAGRLTQQKGFDRLLAMLAALDGAWHLTVLGEGPARSSLEAQAATLGLSEKVAFSGFRNQPWPLYAGADAFLLPSRWEGMSNAALEALACGTPVIACPEAGGIEEVAAIAPPGAVTVAPEGAAYVGALRQVRPAPKGEVRPSLLPSGFDASEVAARFTELVCTLVAERR